MAEPQIRESMKWENDMASVSLAGVRPLAVDTASVGAGAADTHTVAHKAAKRVIIFHASGTDTDIRVAVNETADANDFPVASGVYFVVEAKTGETVSVYNTTGGAITVYRLEIL